MVNPPLIATIIEWLMIISCLVGIVGYMRVYLRASLYLQKRHPELYAKHIAPKPIFGLIPTKDDRRTLWKFAKKHEPIKDPVAEQYLADLVRFIRLIAWLLGILGLAYIASAFLPKG